MQQGNTGCRHVVGEEMEAQKANRDVSGIQAQAVWLEAGPSNPVLSRHCVKVPKLSWGQCLA